MPRTVRARRDLQVAISSTGLLIKYRIWALVQSSWGTGNQLLRTVDAHYQCTARLAPQNNRPGFQINHTLGFVRHMRAAIV